MAPEKGLRRLQSLAQELPVGGISQGGGVEKQMEGLLPLAGEGCLKIVQPEGVIGHDYSALGWQGLLDQGKIALQGIMVVRPDLRPAAIKQQAGNGDQQQPD